MNAVETLLNTVFASILEATWQASVLALLVLVVQWALGRRLSAQWRYVLWFIVVLRLLLPVLPPSPFSLYALFPTPQPARHVEPSAAVIQSTSTLLTETDTQRSPASPFVRNSPQVSPPKPPTATSEGGPVPAVKPLYPSAAPASATAQNLGLHDFWKFGKGLFPWIWMVGMAGLGLRGAVRMVRFTHSIRGCQRVTDPRTLGILDHAAEELGIHPAVALLETPGVVGPALIGWLHPRILVPPGLLSSLSTEEIRYALLHELVHIRRRDLWLNLLVSVLNLVHWFNPLVHLLSRQIRADLEAACDATVLRRLSAREGQGYGRSILRVLESIQAVQARVPMLGMWSDKRQVPYRLRRIVAFSAQRSGRAVPVAVSVGLLLIGLTAADSRQTGVPPAGIDPEPNPVRSASRPQPSVRGNSSVVAPLPTSLNIHVSSDTDQMELGQAEVTWQLQAQSGAERRGTGRSDPSGDCRVDLTAEPLRQLVVEVRAERHWPARYEWKAEGVQPLQPNVFLRLLKVVPVGGRVVDLDGEPLGNAVVTLEVVGQGKTEVTTTEDGSWAIQQGVASPGDRSWPAVRLAVRLAVRHADYVDGFHYWGGVGWDGMQRYRTGSIGGGAMRVDAPLAMNMVLRLAKRVNVTGQVLDNEGHAVSNAELEFHACEAWVLDKDASGPDDSPQPLRVVSDSGGRFTLTDQAAWVPLLTGSRHPQTEGKLGLLDVRAEGFVRQRLHLELPQGIREPLRIVLQRGVALKGRVVDEDGQPVVGVTLRAQEGRAHADSKADGSFELGLVPEGAVEVAIDRGRFVPAIATTLNTTNTFHTLTVRRQPALEVEVIDSVSGKPVPEFGLVIVSNQAMELLKVPHHTDGSGRWSLSLSNLNSQVWQSGDHTVGREAWVKVEVEGYLPALSEGFRLGEETAPLKVALKPAAWLEGTVLTPDGTAAAGAQIALVANPYPVGLPGGFDQGPRAGAAGYRRDSQTGMVLSVFPCLQTGDVRTTDARGSFSLPPRNPTLHLVREQGRGDGPFSFSSEPPAKDDMLVVVHSSGFAEVPVKEFTNGVPISLKSFGTLDCRVGDDPAQSEGWRVLLRRSPDSSAHFLRPGGIPLSPFGAGFVGHDPGLIPGLTVVGGRLQANDLPPGDYNLSFIVPTGPRSGGQQGNFPVTILPGVTNQMHLLSGGREVRGRFVLEGDETPVNWRAHMLAPVPRGRPFTITLLRDLHPADSPTTAGGGPIRVEHRLQFTANDGTFAVANVQPGDYFLHYDLCEVPNQIDETMLPPTFWTPERGSYSDPFPNNLFFDIPASVQGHVARVINAVPVKLLSYPVKIPTSSGADLTKTVELGDIRLHVPKRRRLGQAAPPLQGRREDGSLFELSALRGRWVLLVFGANEPGYPCTEEQLSALAKQRSDIAGDRKVEIVVLSLSTDAQALSKLRSGQKLPWPVVPVGPWAQSKAAADYNVIAVPEISLVNPDGRIAAVHLTGQKLLDVVDALELDKATALAKLQAAKTQLAEFQARYPGNNNHVHALDLQQRIQWLERQVEPEPGEESAAKR